MSNPRDATIDIPLTTVTSRTGARKIDSNSPLDYGRQESYPDFPASEKDHLRKQYPAGRRRKVKGNERNKKGEDGEEDTLTQMGKIYDRILHFSIVTRYFLYVLPLALLIAIPIIIGATGREATLGGVRLVWFFSWVEIVWLSLWVSKLVAKALPYVFRFLCGIVSSGTRKYMLVLKALEIPLSLVGWALTSLATFIPIMTHNPTQRSQQEAIAEAAAEAAAATTTSSAPAASATAGALNSLSSAFDPKSKNGTEIQHWQSIVQKILAALLVASLLLLIEKLVIQLISIGYHRKQFNAKIKDSKHNIYLLSLLYDASRALFPAYCHEFAEEDYIINDSLELGDSKKGSGHNRSGSATPMRILQNVGRFGDKVTSVFGNIAHEVTGKQIFAPGSAHSVVVEALEKNKSSEALAKRLWMSFVVEGKEALYEDDIVEVLGNGHHAEAEECFACLDRDGNGDISLDEMILTVCEFGRERHSIANSLHDVDQAINVLDGLLSTIVFIMCIFVFVVAFLNSSFTTTLATAGTALLSLSFVFATTAQEVLGSCIFLFVKHPFDVLDRVDIGDQELVVEHISLLFTVFKKVNTGKLTQTANVVLNTQWIQNVSRSKAMKEQLLLYVHFDTTLEDVQLLKNEILAFVRDRDNSRDFQPDVDVEVTGIHEMNKLELKVEIRHKSNWANETVRAARRSKFMCALVLALRKIPIYAPGGGDAVLGSSDKPAYSVTVSDEEAAAARKAWDKTKEEKRLVPTPKPAQPPDTAKSSATDVANPKDPATPPPLRYRLPPLNETAALTDLNSRHPAADTARDAPDLEVEHSAGLRESSESRRNSDIEEVRGLLRRQSTRGKRKASSNISPAQIPPSISETVPSAAAGAPPVFSPSSANPPSSGPLLFPTPPSGTGNQSQPFPPRTTSSQLPPLDFDSPQLQYRPPPQQQQQTLPQHPSLHSPTSPMSEVPSRSPSGITNPYTAQALRSQQSLQSMQGHSPPQIRHPVPGGGNAFAREAREAREREEQERERRGS
ncbi:MAG: hypothetical protein LQ344_000841 [Seirophora lacunosa]|nr:MAG: hypothetical protein LQ344_000841 [Seirophora lacunosa]